MALFYIFIHNVKKKIENIICGHETFPWWESLTMQKLKRILVIVELLISIVPPCLIKMPSFYMMNSGTVSCRKCSDRRGHGRTYKHLITSEIVWSSSLENVQQSRWRLHVTNKNIPFFVIKVSRLFVHQCTLCVDLPCYAQDFGKAKDKLAINIRFTVVSYCLPVHMSIILW